MKKLLTILSLFICSIVIGQYKSLDKNDTTTYNEISSDPVELLEFGYKYIGQNIILRCKFWEIYNGVLDNTPETNRGKSTEGGMSYYNPEKVKELVGFRIKLYKDGSSDWKGYYQSYGYQKDILDNIKKYKDDDDIVVLGKVVKWTNGEDVGIRVKYVYTLDEYNNSVTTQTEETKSDVTYKSKEKSFFDIILEKIVIIVIIIIVMGVFVYIKNRNKKED